MGILFCDGCPLGYSAVGGQTLNPYGRKVFESGGSSSEVVLLLLPIML
ncbi:MAG: hypothetical protein CM15mP32_0650 [Flavobacteriaceae bacterium]|nr:MAG: hypothetical protein CM15mP32_0650 [Flavobacteriaceae bacterium]